MSGEDRRALTRRRLGLMAGLLAGSLAVLLAPAEITTSSAGTVAPRQSYQETFTTDKPNTPTGMVLKVDWLGNQPGEKPPTITQDVFTFAAGSKLDFSVPAICKATDAQLERRGPSACPRTSMVGGGTVDLDTGKSVWLIPRIVKTRAWIFDGGAGKLITLAQTTNLPTPIPIRFVDRGTVSGTSITTMNPALPGFPPPDNFVAVKRDRIRFFVVTKGSGANRRGFLTTPPSCPAGGQWMNVASFSYHDGVTQQASSASACTP